MRQYFTGANTNSALLVLVIAGVAWGANAAGGLSAPSTVRVVLAGVLGVVGWRMVRTVGPADPDLEAEAARPGFERAALMSEPVGEGLPEALQKLDALLNGVVAGARDMHVGLRPVLRDIALDRLHTQRGIDLDRSPEAARALLGDQLYDIVRPDRRPTQDRGSAGVSPKVIDSMVTALENL